MTHGRILCEGFYDRAFWVGLAGSFGWKSDPQRGQREGVTGKGRYFLSKDDRGLIVQPVGGSGQITLVLQPLLQSRSTDRHPFPWLIVNCDADTRPDAASEVVKGTVAQLGLKEAEAARLVPFTWTSPTLEHAANDDLERLIRSAVANAYPDRDAVVRRWMNEPGLAVEAGKESKAHVFALMAGWAADRGCEQFYEAVWQDAAIAKELRTILEASPEWPRVEACLGVGVA
jgi:hypothetical protein